MGSKQYSETEIKEYIQYQFRSYYFPLAEYSMFLISCCSVIIELQIDLKFSEFNTLSNLPYCYLDRGIRCKQNSTAR